MMLYRSRPAAKPATMPFPTSSPPPPTHTFWSGWYRRVAQLLPPQRSFALLARAAVSCCNSMSVREFGGVPGKQGEQQVR